MGSLTPAERKIYDWLAQREDPFEDFSVTFLARRRGVSKVTVFMHLREMEEKGFVERVPVRRGSAYHRYRIRQMPIDRLQKAISKAARVCMRVGNERAAQELIMALGEFRRLTPSVVVT